MINVRQCMMMLLIELYMYIPPSVTLTTFQGHSNVEQFFTFLKNVFLFTDQF